MCSSDSERCLLYQPLLNSPFANSALLPNLPNATTQACSQHAEAASSLAPPLLLHQAHPPQPLSYLSPEGPPPGLPSNAFLSSCAFTSLKFLKPLLLVTCCMSQTPTVVTRPRLFPWGGAEGSEGNWPVSEVSRDWNPPPLGDTWLQTGRPTQLERMAEKRDFLIFAKGSMAVFPTSSLCL